MTDVSYAPRKHVAAWLRKGWRLCADHDYDPNDWAIVMRYAPDARLLSEAEIEAQAARFKREFAPIKVGTRNQGSTSGNAARCASRWKDRVYDKCLRRLVAA
jgi:hypothetical protein